MNVIKDWGRGAVHQSLPCPGGHPAPALGRVGGAGVLGQPHKYTGRQNSNKNSPLIAGLT